MKHSNRAELESYYREELETARQAKRINNLQGDNYKNEEKPLRKTKSIFRIPCCLVLIIILATSGVIIYFVYKNLKNPIYQEYLKNEETIKNTPELIQGLGGDVVQKVENGKELYDEVQENKRKFDEFRDKVDDTNQAITDTMNGFASNDLFE